MKRIPSRYALATLSTLKAAELRQGNRRFLTHDPQHAPGYQQSTQKNHGPGAYLFPLIVPADAGSVRDESVQDTDSSPCKTPHSDCLRYHKVHLLFA